MPTTTTRVSLPTGRRGRTPSPRVNSRPMAFLVELPARSQPRQRVQRVLCHHGARRQAQEGPMARRHPDSSFVVMEPGAPATTAAAPPTAWAASTAALPTSRSTSNPRPSGSSADARSTSKPVLQRWTHRVQQHLHPRRTQALGGLEQSVLRGRHLRQRGLDSVQQQPQQRPKGAFICMIYAIEDNSPDDGWDPTGYTAVWD